MKQNMIVKETDQILETKITNKFSFKGAPCDRFPFPNFAKKRKKAVCDFFHDGEKCYSSYKKLSSLQGSLSNSKKGCSLKSLGTILIGEKARSFYRSFAKRHEKCCTKRKLLTGQNLSLLTLFFLAVLTNGSLAANESFGTSVGSESFLKGLVGSDKVWPDTTLNSSLDKQKRKLVKRSGPRIGGRSLLWLSRLEKAIQLSNGRKNKENTPTPVTAQDKLQDKKFCSPRLACDQKPILGPNEKNILRRGSQEDGRNLQGFPGSETASAEGISAMKDIKNRGVYNFNLRQPQKKTSNEKSSSRYSSNKLSKSSFDEEIINPKRATVIKSNDRIHNGKLGDIANVFTRKNGKTFGSVAVANRSTTRELHTQRKFRKANKIKNFLSKFHKIQENSKVNKLEKTKHVREVGESSWEDSSRNGFATGGPKSIPLMKFAKVVRGASFGSTKDPSSEGEQNIRYSTGNVINSDFDNRKAAANDDASKYAKESKFMEMLQEKRNSHLQRKMRRKFIKHFHNLKNNINHERASKHKIHKSAQKRRINGSYSNESAYIMSYNADTTKAYNTVASGRKRKKSSLMKKNVNELHKSYDMQSPADFASHRRSLARQKRSEDQLESYTASDDRDVFNASSKRDMTSGIQEVIGYSTSKGNLMDTVIVNTQSSSLSENLKMVLDATQSNKDAPRYLANKDRLEINESTARSHYDLNVDYATLSTEKSNSSYVTERSDSEISAITNGIHANISPITMNVPTTNTTSSGRSEFEAIISRSPRSFKGQTRLGNSRKSKTATDINENSNCSLGYFGCNDGSCILVDRFCNGENDCPKGEDEPPHCTPCGHIYYGEVGRTYEIQVRWPRRNLRDSTCNVTLVAAGGPHGDIVQVAFKKFSLGKFYSHTDRGCPHGHMQIVENMRPYRPGYWCGDGVGLDIFYSETPSVSLLLTRLKLDNDLTAIDSVTGFYFRMSYQFLRQNDAIVRYGQKDKQKFTGLRNSNSACDIIFAGCDSRPCYIQSPNFPGLYPRNITCYYHIIQNQVPNDKRAVITLQQRRPQLINVKSSKQPLDTEKRTLKLYDDCYYVGDYVRVYDGNSTKSPVLVTFCRGGRLPDITSSRSSLLIEFTTSPYDSPTHEFPWKFVSGFELVARTVLIDKKQIGNACNQIISPQVNSTGWISNPIHSIPPNTSCSWGFKAPPGYMIWIIFAGYIRETQVTRHQTKLCEARLTIEGISGANSTAMASHCRDTVPKTCARIVRLENENNTVPACGPRESYVTHGSEATISQEYGEGSLVTKVKFLARYEFIDARQEGEKRFLPCSRIIRSSGTKGVHKLSAPKDVFLYGRGGRKSVQCSWLIQGQPDEAIQLTIKSMKAEGSTCRTLVHPLTENLDCDGGGNPVMKLQLSEVPWDDVEVPRACICSKEVLSHTIESRGSALLLNMTLLGMGPGDDHRTFNFDVEFKFLTKPKCPGGSRKLDEPAGRVTLGSSDHPVDCDTRPWLLEAPIGYSFLLTLPRATLANESCSTDSRLVLRTPGVSDTLVVVCPAAAQDAVIQLVWPPIASLKEPSSKAAFIHDFVRGVPQLIAQWEPRRASALSMRWLHIRDPRKIYPGDIDISAEMSSEKPCKELCEALGACIAEELWCDGVEHCPDGSDETLANCIMERVPWLYLTMVILTILVLILISSSTMARQQRHKPCAQHGNSRPYHHHHHQTKNNKETRRASTQESILPAKDNHHRLSAYTPEEFTDMDFETTV